MPTTEKPILNPLAGTDDNGDDEFVLLTVADSIRQARNLAKSKSRHRLREMNAHISPGKIKELAKNPRTSLRKNNSRIMLQENHQRRSASLGHVAELLQRLSPNKTLSTS